jgi:predicted DCC family thiol-disulfide oxidoreductase YuxK
MMREFGLSSENAETFVLVFEGRAYVRSEAAILVARHLKYPWRLLGTIRVFPRAIRNWGYDFVARNRYQWFGRAESCMVPTADVRARFILD